MNHEAVLTLRPHEPPTLWDAVRRFATCLVVHRTAVATLARRELKVRYAGTAIGTFLVVLPQIATLAVYWFVFSVGLRVTPSQGVPFIAFFVTGFVPWSLFNETLTNAGSVVSRYAPLVKKTVFPSEVLPLSELVVALVTHAVMLVIVMLILWVSGLTFSVHMLEAAYYLCGLCVFSLGLALLVSSMNVLLPDIGHLLGVVLNVWFWLTPIVWEASRLGGPLRRTFSLNPLFYVVEGYRASFLDQVPAWRAPGAALWFWLASLAALASGIWVFERLKPRFVEAL